MTDLAVRILSAPLGRTHIFYAGQAGYVFKSSNGTLLGIDLYLTDCVERVEGNIGFKRLLPRIMNPGEIVFDYLIATHPHFDHFDMDAIPIMMSNHHTKLLASVNCEKEVKRLMMTNENITYVKEGDIKNADDIIVECVYCDHGEGAPDAFGVVLTIDNKKIYIAGDTCLHLDKTAYFNEKGPYDLMIAPINGAYGNLNESECVELSKALKPKLTIPCHFGMFASHGGNPGIFIKEMNKCAPLQQYRLMTMGEELSI